MAQGQTDTGWCSHQDPTATWGGGQQESRALSPGRAARAHQWRRQQPGLGTPPRKWQGAPYSRNASVPERSTTHSGAQSACLHPDRAPPTPSAAHTATPQHEALRAWGHNAAHAPQHSPVPSAARVQPQHRVPTERSPTLSILHGPAMHTGSTQPCSPPRWHQEPPHVQPGDVGTHHNTQPNATNNTAMPLRGSKPKRHSPHATQ